MDSLEFNTDKIFIQHGLGKKLEAWRQKRKQRLTYRYNGTDTSVVIKTGSSPN